MLRLRMRLLEASTVERSELSDSCVIRDRLGAALKTASEPLAFHADHLVQSPALGVRKAGHMEGEAGGV